ncbi:MAG: nicotinamide riboside transporter PnuC [Fimbriimonadaceae bacterium]
MKLKTWQVSLILALASYVVCILAQAIPNFLAKTPPLLFPTDQYNQIELVGFTAGVIGVYLMVKESAWNYPIGLIWAVAYGWYFYSVARHLGEATVMIINAGYLIDGWIKWARKTDQPNLPITNLKRHHWIVIGITLLIVIPVLIKLLIEFRGNYVYFDAATTTLGLTAQYLTNRKVFQCWYFWIAANIVIIPVFIIREYYPTAILYSIFTVMAFIGINQWRKSMRSQDENNL